MTSTREILVVVAAVRVLVTSTKAIPTLSASVRTEGLIVAVDAAISTVMVVVMKLVLTDTVTRDPSRVMMEGLAVTRAVTITTVWLPGNVIVEGLIVTVEAGMVRVLVEMKVTVMAGRVVVEAF